MQLIELYNFRDDVNETRNLAYEPEYSEKVEYYRHLCDSIAATLMAARVENFRDTK